MAYFWELCSLQDPEEASILIEAAGKSLQNSVYTLVGGTPSSHYFDMDLYLREEEKAEKTSKLLAKKIDEISKSNKYKFNKVAFIDKGEIGPVGVISLLGTVRSKISIDAIIVRPKKLLLKAAIKGEIKQGDRVLILSDIATTGRTIFRAAEKIVALGGKVIGALVVFDRRQGATQNLGRVGIQLFSLTSTKSLNSDERSKEELKSKYGRGIKDIDYEPILLDFGGRTSTHVI